MRHYVAAAELAAARPSSLFTQTRSTVVAARRFQPVIQDRRAALRRNGGRTHFLALFAPRALILLIVTGHIVLLHCCSTTFALQQSSAIPNCPNRLAGHDLLKLANYGDSALNLRDYAPSRRSIECTGLHCHRNCGRYGRYQCTAPPARLSNAPSITASLRAA